MAENDTTKEVKDTATGRPPVPDSSKGERHSSWATLYHPCNPKETDPDRPPHLRGIGAADVFCHPGLACANNELPHFTIVRYTDSVGTVWDLLVVDEGDEHYFGSRESRKVVPDRDPDFYTCDYPIDVAVYPLDGSSTDYTPTHGPIVKTGPTSIVIFRPNSGDKEIEDYRNWLIKCINDGKVAAPSTHIPGATWSPSGPNDPVLHLNKLLASAQFMNGYIQGAQDGTYTVNQYINTQLERIYCHMYDVPTLYEGKSLVVKPKCYFVKPPKCNVILPPMKSSLSYSSNVKEAPTRIILSADPMQIMNAGKPTANIYGVAYLDEELVSKSEYNTDPKYAQFPTNDLGVDVYAKCFRGANSPNFNKLYPVVQNITDFETRNIVKTGKLQMGADLALYVMSDSKTNLYYDGNTGGGTLGALMARLAQYVLAEQHYGCYNGNAAMAFHPYLVPGLPFVNVEARGSSLCMYGYITNVVHNLSHDNWTTTISYTMGRLDTDNPPNCQPIIEDAWHGNLTPTYQKMLGPNILPVQSKDIDAWQDSICSKNTEVSDCYPEIWREIQSLDDWRYHFGHGCTLENADGKTFMVLSNNPELKGKKDENSRKNWFFNEDLQEQIKDYSKKVWGSTPFYINEVN